MSTNTHIADALRVEHLQTDLRGRSVRGGALTLSAQVAKFLLQTLSTIVMARLLTPADFGIVAMVTAITGIANVFADVGLSEATIQRDEISQGQVSALFWINIAVGLVCMFLIAALAPVLAWLYAEPRLVSITLLMAVTFPINGLRVQHDALLKRQMQYKSLAVRDVASYVLGAMASIGMAYFGGGYWAIVALPMTVNTTQMVLSWLMVSWRPSFPARTRVNPMLTYGIRLAASNLTAYVSRSADNVLIGWYWGAGPLGLYSRAYNLLMLPLRQLNAPLRSVAIPAFSRIGEDPERFARYYLRLANLIMWISAPLIGFLLVAAEPVVVLTLGDRWREAASIFQILAFAALFQPLFDTTEWLLASRGRTDRLLKLGIAMSPALVASFLIGLPFGVRSVAFCYSAFWLAMLPFGFKFTFQDTNLNLKRLGAALLCPLSVCLAAVLLSGLTVRMIDPRSNLSQLAVIAAAFIAVYSFSLIIPAARNEICSFRNIAFELRTTARAKDHVSV